MAVVLCKCFFLSAELWATTGAFRIEGLGGNIARGTTRRKRPRPRRRRTRPRRQRPQSQPRQLKSVEETARNEMRADASPLDPRRHAGDGSAALRGPRRHGGDREGPASPTAPRNRTGSAEKSSAQGPVASKYNQTDAARLYDYARLAACNREAVENWRCGALCESAKVVPGSVRFLEDILLKVQCYVAQVPTGLQLEGFGRAPWCVAACRGSVAARNWINNLAVIPKPWPPTKYRHSSSKSDLECPGCRIHAGFAAGYNRLRGQMFDAIDNIGCRSIRFAGHSMGGAISTLASFEARSIPGLHVGTVNTYGVPRIGNEAFVAAFSFIKSTDTQTLEPPMWRIVHGKDPVPRLPPRILGYAHIPTEIYYDYNASDKYRVCTSTLADLEDPTCAFATGLEKCNMSDHTGYFKDSKLLKDKIACLGGKKPISQIIRGV